MAEPGALREGGIDESVASAADLALGEWPEFNRLHPARQRVGKRPQAEHPS